MNGHCTLINLSSVGAARQAYLQPITPCQIGTIFYGCSSQKDMQADIFLNIIVEGFIYYLPNRVLSTQWAIFRRIMPHF